MRDSRLTTEGLQKGVRINEVRGSDKEKSTQAAVLTARDLTTQYQADLLQGGESGLSTDNKSVVGGSWAAPQSKENQKNPQLPRFHGLTSSFLPRGEVHLDIEFCCRLEQLGISWGTSTGPLQNRQRNPDAASFSNSYFQAQVGLKVEIQVELAELLGGCLRHRTLPALKRHRNAIKLPIWLR